MRDLTPFSLNATPPEPLHRPRCGQAGLALAVFTLTFLGLTTWWFGSMNGIWSASLSPWTCVLWVKTFMEVVASEYAVFYVLVALSYRTPADPSQQVGAVSQPSLPSPAADDPDRVDSERVVVGYLCCDDLDVDALESIVRNCGTRKTSIVIHDDSTTLAARDLVDQTADRLTRDYRRDITIVRRTERTGGKPGAVNNLVKQLAGAYELLLLCDSDSYFYDRATLSRALRYFEDPAVALVQFRSIGHVHKGDGRGLATLSESVTFYDAFVWFMDRFGWSPFLGHNALLRLDVFSKVGGFTPGQFADDIDYSVRLRLAGHEIRYARDVVAGERHPETYGALRRRTFKWAYGCTQVLRDNGWGVATSSQLSVAEKLTFFLTVGYYHFQMLLVGYLVVFYLLLPFVDPRMGGLVNLLFGAGIILLLTFLPSVSYFMLQRRALSWLRIVTVWGFVYGSQDFVMFRAILSCLMRRSVQWTPTNMPAAKRSIRYFLPELGFGSLVVMVALTQQPLLLLLPTTILFAGKYLATPIFQRIVFTPEDSRTT